MERKEQSEEELKAERLLRDENVRRVGGQIAVFILIPFTLPLIVFFVFQKTGATSFSKADLGLVSSAFAIYIATILSLHFIINQIRVLANGSLELIGKRNETVADLIEQKLATTIQTLPGLAEVINAMAKMYELAVEQHNSGKKDPSLAEVMRDFSDRDQNEQVRDVAISYFGAATITPTEDQKVKAEAADEYRETPVESFFKWNAEVHNLSIGFRRYVRFYEVPSFGRRSKQVRERYLRWMERQIKLIQSNENYVLLDSRRAPRFLALTSFAIGPGTYIGILGEGDSGFKVRGSNFAADQLKSALDFIYSNPNARPTSYRKSKGLDKLQAHYALLLDFHNDPDKIAESRKPYSAEIAHPSMVEANPSKTDSAKSVQSKAKTKKVTSKSSVQVKAKNNVKRQPHKKMEK